MTRQPCANIAEHNFCRRFGSTVHKCPSTCTGYVSFQADLFSDSPEAELDEWIRLNPIPYAAICNEFTRQGLCEVRWISVRDIWSWARTNFIGIKTTDGSDYVFNNNLTPALSKHLCKKYPQFADRVHHRGDWKAMN